MPRRRGHLTVQLQGMELVQYETMEPTACPVLDQCEHFCIDYIM